MTYVREHDDYFLIIYDDHQGNIDTEGRIEDGIIRYLKDKGFSCRAGYWSCPWFFDIRHKFFCQGDLELLMAK